MTANPVILGVAFAISGGLLNSMLTPYCQNYFADRTKGGLAAIAFTIAIILIVGVIAGIITA